jgi:hypothetical protein
MHWEEVPIARRAVNADAGGFAKVPQESCRAVGRRTLTDCALEAFVPPAASDWPPVGAGPPMMFLFAGFRAGELRATSCRDLPEPFGRVRNLLRQARNSRLENVSRSGTAPGSCGGQGAGGRTGRGHCPDGGPHGRGPSIRSDMNFVNDHIEACCDRSHKWSGMLGTTLAGLAHMPVRRMALPHLTSPGRSRPVGLRHAASPAGSIGPASSATGRAKDGFLPCPAAIGLADCPQLVAAAAV